MKAPIQRIVNIEQEKEYIKKIQKCQRNWDYSKTMPKEHVDYLLWVAQNAPSKQHEAYYDIHYSTDRKVIEELYKWSWGYTHSGKPPATWRNPQMNANLFMLFVMKHPPTSRNYLNHGSVTPTDHPARWENGLVAVGTALGLVMRAAVELGYATGCNKNNSQGPDCDFNWERRMGLYEDIHIHKKKKMLYGVGIGYSQEGRPRNESDDNELVIGAANGHNLSLKDRGEERDVRGRKYRQCSIVDISKSDKATDPYGNVHELPDKAVFYTMSHLPREINIYEIK